MNIGIRVSHWANVFFFSALLHRSSKAAGYAVLLLLLHCVACVARLKKIKHSARVEDSDWDLEEPLEDGTPLLQFYVLDYTGGIKAAY